MKKYADSLLLAWTCLLFYGCTPQPETTGVPNLIPLNGDMPCEREPTAYVVGEKYNENVKKTCIATAKIQAIAYECGHEDDTLEFTDQALKDNIKQAQLKCNAFCKKLDESCVGVLTAPSRCGLVSPPGMSLEFGKKTMQCPKRCKGQAFNYCSIYQANFFATADRSLFASAKENCTCKKQ